MSLVKYFKRDSTWQMYKPGLYLDPAGYPHIFPDEICAALGWPYNRENYDLVVQTVREMVGRVEIAIHERADS